VDTPEPAPDPSPPGPEPESANNAAAAAGGRGAIVVTVGAAVFSSAISEGMDLVTTMNMVFAIVLHKKRG
jgi:hypothetical protein